MLKEDFLAEGTSDFFIVKNVFDGVVLGREVDHEGVGLLTKVVGQRLAQSAFP
jgi:hypothetical protein